MKINNSAVPFLMTIPSITSAWSLGNPNGMNGLIFPRGSLMMDSPAVRMLFDDNLASCSGGPMMRRSRRRRNAFQQSSPRYEIVDNEDKFELAVDVPGVKMEDMSISLEENILTVSGSRDISNENRRFTSRFAQSFSLDPSVDVDKFSAKLENGVLIVTAPKDLKRIEANVRKIPIHAGIGAVDMNMTDGSSVETKVNSKTSNADAMTNEVKQDETATDKVHDMNTDANANAEDGMQSELLDLDEDMKGPTATSKQENNEDTDVTDGDDNKST